MRTSPIQRHCTDAGTQRKSVLVVEDESLIRMMLSDELREQGYHVVEACNADEALGVLGELVPDLVISDVQMPGSLDGLELLRVVRERFPSLPVIIASGHYQLPHDFVDEGSRFVAKPYTCHSLIEIAQRLVGDAVQTTTTPNHAPRSRKSSIAV